MSSNLTVSDFSKMKLKNNPTNISRHPLALQSMTDDSWSIDNYSKKSENGDPSKTCKQQKNISTILSKSILSQLFIETKIEWKPRNEKLGTNINVDKDPQGKCCFSYVSPSVPVRTALVFYYYCSSVFWHFFFFFLNSSVLSYLFHRRARIISLETDARCIFWQVRMKHKAPSYRYTNIARRR